MASMEIELKEKYDVLLKLIIIGDSSVGKSCILNNYLRNSCKFPQIYQSKYSFQLTRIQSTQWV